MSSDYAWVITKDWFFEDSFKAGDTSLTSEVGISGPRNATDEMIKLAQTKGRTFRMYDDDNILMYSGKLYETPETENENEFGPLDDFGTPNAGCTIIKYYDSKTKKWETL